MHFFNAPSLFLFSSFLVRETNRLSEAGMKDELFEEKHHDQNCDNCMESFIRHEILQKAAHCKLIFKKR